METLILIASVVLMVIFFGLCIIVHEFGHFIVARFCGLHIEAFSVGFKKIWGKKINGVEYRIGCIPCGGYVDLPQIDSTSDEITDSAGNPLPHAEPWKRIVTAFAGPLFNIIFGLVLGVAIWIVGLPQPDSDRYTEFTVREVPEDCPEYRAGLRAGDCIVKLNGNEFDLSWNEFMQKIMLNDDNVKQVTLEVVRDGKTSEISYTPAENDKLMPGEKVALPFFQPELRVYVYPMPGSAAKKAGIQPEDRVITVDGEPVYGADDLMSRINFSGGNTLAFVVERGGKQLEIPVTPTEIPGAKERLLVGINFFYGSGPTIDNYCIVADTIPGLPAASVLRPGDVIMSFNGTSLKDTSRSFPELLEENGEKEITLGVERGGEQIEVKLTPRTFVPYEIGVSFYRIEHPTPWKQFVNVLKMTQRTLKSLGHTIQSKVGQETGYTTIGMQNLSGPLGIGRYMIMTFQGSFMRGLYLVVVISFSLGLFNLLPIPVLDGGHIMIALIEIVIRRRIPVKLVQPVTYFFMFVLISFMAVVSFFDVKKMLPPRWSNALEFKVHRAASETEEPGAEAEASPVIRASLAQPEDASADAGAAEKPDNEETQAQPEAADEAAGE
ncbi:MAG: site-2 protease family protein [Lentisphaeria bacterium]|nr:site-2 protease family protein [Lentisphaeria bacterium]